jgi:hypothetical protein
MITREMVIAKIAAMLHDPVWFKIFLKWDLQFTEYSIGRIQVFRNTAILWDGTTSYYCNILNIRTELPQDVCEEIFRYINNEYEKRKEWYRQDDIKHMVEYVTITV